MKDNPALKCFSVVLKQFVDKGLSNVSVGGEGRCIFHVCLLSFSYPRTVFKEVPVRRMTFVKWLASSDSQQTAVGTFIASASAVAVGTTMRVVKTTFCNIDARRHLFLDGTDEEATQMRRTLLSWQLSTEGVRQTHEEDCKASKT